MKTILLNPPWKSGDMYGVRAGSRWPHMEDARTSCYMPFPFFLAYAAAKLEKEGETVEVIDACAERMDEKHCLKLVVEKAPDLISLETATTTIDADLCFASKIKKNCPNVLIVMCGPHEPMYNKAFIEANKHIDFVMCGEYEETLCELVKSIAQGSTPDDIRGLIFRKKNGSAQKNESRPIMECIDNLPWPARHLFPMEKYHDTPGGIPEPSVQLWASRGCPYQCTFCLWPRVMYNAKTYRVRDPKDVVAELEYCVSRWRFRSFYFDDDTFNIGKRRTIQLCRELKKKRINLPWAVMARADQVDYEMLREMKDAGMVSIKFGVESAMQDILDRSKKRLKIEAVEEAVRLCKELDIDAHLTFTLGLLGETEETVRKTVEKAKQLDPYSVQFSILTPFPGTEFYEELKKKNLLVVREWEYYNGSVGAVHRTVDMSKEQLDRALRWANSAWNWYRISSPKRWPRLFKEALRQPKEACYLLLDGVKGALASIRIKSIL